MVHNEQICNANAPAVLLLYISLQQNHPLHYQRDSRVKATDQQLVD